MLVDRPQQLNSQLVQILFLLLIAVPVINMLAQNSEPQQPAKPELAKPQLLDSPPTPRPIRLNTRGQEDDQTTLKARKLKFTKQGGVVYQTIAGEELKCDIYTPEGNGPFPAILAVHGGAWRQGSKFTMIRHAWKMAQSGYVVVAINYRHAPEHRFPAQIHDCKHAVRWMKSNSAKFKINPSRIGAFGYSAGGHLVALLGTTDQDDGLEGTIAKGFEKHSTRVQAVVAGGAPCEFSWIEDNSKALAYWLGGSPKQKRETYRIASPTTYVSPDDPAFFFFHGTSDLLVPISTSETLHESLKCSGVPSQHFQAKRSGHLATFSDLRWMAKAIAFFDIHLKKDVTTESPQPKK